jgi:NSS family neurotransmitter:Na+ symporter
VSTPASPSVLPGQREAWSGRLGFILATVGAAIGLGSIWKFPYEVGANGGGAFVAFYLLGLTFIVFPLMLAEFAIGRRGGTDATSGMAIVAAALGAARGWAIIGALGVITSFLILRFYAVVGGWALAYAVETVRDGLPGVTAGAVQGRYDALLASPFRILLYDSLFMAITVLIVGRGIAGGIEQACKILMPVMVVLVAILAGYSIVQGDVAATLRFLFAVDLTRTSAKVALEAVGLGFFSIGVGLAIMVTYAAYAERDLDLREVAVVTIVGDTAISFLAGFAVFPVVFAERLDPASGPGLMFVSLPLAFARLPLGAVAATAFFVLLTVAALASAISMLEMPVALLHRRYAMSRRSATLICGSACWVLGLASVLSFNRWAAWYPLAAVPAFKSSTLFDLLDHLTSNMLLPLGGFGLAVFAGWVLPPSVLADELRLGHATTRLLRFLLRYIVPIAIAAASVVPYLL